MLVSNVQVFEQIDIFKVEKSEKWRGWKIEHVESPKISF